MRRTVENAALLATVFWLARNATLIRLKRPDLRLKKLEQPGDHPWDLIVGDEDQDGYVEYTLPTRRVAVVTDEDGKPVYRIDDFRSRKGRDPGARIRDGERRQAWLREDGVFVYEDDHILVEYLGE